MERILLQKGAPWREAADRAAEILRGGGVAILPAEGIYGFHALAESARGVERLLALKPRAEEKRFIGLIADPAEMSRYAEATPRATQLAREHWPGALTLVLRAAPEVPDSLKNAEGTIALRCPGNPLLRAVVEAARGIVLSTSANEPGKPPGTRPEGALAERADLVVDQGPLSGTPSTVVAIDGDRVRVLREGVVRVGGSRS